MNDLYPAVVQNLRQELILYVPFLSLLALNIAANLKKEHRFRQFPMPVLSILYCILSYALVERNMRGITQLASYAIDQIPMDKVEQLSGFMSGYIKDTVNVVKDNQSYMAAISANVMVLTTFITFKGACIAAFNKIFEKKNEVLEAVIGTMYQYDEEDKNWHLKKELYEARNFMKVFYFTGLVLAVLGMMAAKRLFDYELITEPYFPAFFVIVIGEIYFLLDSVEKKKKEEEEDGEKQKKFLDYSSLREILRRLFNDKLCAEDTTVDQIEFEQDKIRNYLENLETGATIVEEGYAKFLRRRLAQKQHFDVNYANSGLNLLKGQSVLFNNPFFYDAIPYVPYVMNRTLLRHKKILIILGRHGLEEEVLPWVREGLNEVTHIDGMWRIGMLTDKESNLDVGVIARSDVHNTKLHEANKLFFEAAEMVIIMEPSRLITTAQIGLNSIVRLCRKNQIEKRLVFCSFDKNCDGLVDSLSHILMTSLVEVTATLHHRGVSSYMSWEGDSEPLQHRLLPNLSRYMGFGTELSLVALKNHIESTEWYGGEAFPVLDIHWIAGQYYYDLMKYAGLPAQQSQMDQVMKYSSSMWSAKVKPEAYITVEDESCNMFEVQREFSTRFEEQGFINIISPSYMLKDYMAENNSVFTSDPKAIPYICADYSHTRRNVMLRLCLRMCTDKVTEDEIRRELNLLSIQTTDPVITFWKELCSILSDNPDGLKNYQQIPLLIVSSDIFKERGDSRTIVTEKKNHDLEEKRYEYAFDVEIVKRKKEYSFEKGEMINTYTILDPVFERLLLGDLKSAQYITEDELGNDQYLGSEILGLLFQKYLPGQFFVFNGKYYEMLRTSANGKIIVRRASDHIEGRKEYRQVRRYSLQSVKNSEVMGDVRKMDKISIAKAYADIAIDTIAYWDLDSYNDFENGRKLEVNGIPMRYYRNKSILKLQIPDVSKEILGTLCLLIQEVLRSVLAENAPYVAVITDCDLQEPLTYYLDRQKSDLNTDGDGTIYFIEDSQLDIGLLDAIGRNIDRILAIVADYLEWNDDQLNEEPADEGTHPENTEEETTENEGEVSEVAEQPDGPIQGLFRRIEQWLHADPSEKARRKAEKTAEREKKAEERAEKKRLKAEEKANKKAEAQAAKEAEEKKKAEEAARTTETTETEETVDLSEAETKEPEKRDEASEPPQVFYSIEPGDGIISEEVNLEEDSSEPENKETQIQVETEEGTQKVVREMKEGIPELTKRKPYSERYYLRYGGYEGAGKMQWQGVRDLLKALHYDNGSLKKTRKGINTAFDLENSIYAHKNGKHFCSFCGEDLTMMEYEVLKDGRERCSRCSETAIRDIKQFNEMYKSVCEDLKLFFDVEINAPINIKVVNAKKIENSLNKGLVPQKASTQARRNTKEPEKKGRTLGLAIKKGKRYTILMENGAPRMISAMTLVHEMTHIWQYINWKDEEIVKKYGEANKIRIYEGMAKWAEIQYMYLKQETAFATKEEMITVGRKDEYGEGFMMYRSAYPLRKNGSLSKGRTPFNRIPPFR